MLFFLRSLHAYYVLKILLWNPTPVAVVQDGGTKTLVMCKTSQWNNFFVSLPFKDHHGTAPSQSTDPLSLVGFLVYFLFLFHLAMPQDLQNLSCLNRDRT